MKYTLISYDSYKELGFHVEGCKLAEAKERAMEFMVKNSVPTATLMINFSDGRTYDYIDLRNKALCDKMFSSWVKTGKWSL